MIVSFYSDYYDKTVNLDDNELEILYGIYVNVCNEEGLVPEVSSHDAINSGEIYDHVAYHVETFGTGIEGYSEIEHLF